MNLKLVQVQNNMIGQMIVREWEKRPHEIIEMLFEQYECCPKKIVKLIGEENAIKLGLVDPFEKFKMYWEKKTKTVGPTDPHLQRFKTAFLLYDTEPENYMRLLKKARRIITDLGLPLKADIHTKTGDLKISKY